MVFAALMSAHLQSWNGSFECPPLRRRTRRRARIPKDGKREIFRSCSKELRPQQTAWKNIKSDCTLSHNTPMVDYVKFASVGVLDQSDTKQCGEIDEAARTGALLGQ